MSQRTSDDTIKNLMALGLCNAAGFGHVASIAETVAYSAFTDGGSTAGTYQMRSTIPAGALLLLTRILVPTGFTGDTTATVTVGDGSDVDRYMTGTPSVFTTAATGIDAGVVSGLKHLTAANRPTITITSGSDWGLVTAGSITVQVYFIATASLS